MSTTTTFTAGELARRTPSTRDRYVDFLRLFSIVVVVLGHWLMAVVDWHGSTFHTDNVIGHVPGLWIATWGLQVMPIFFFVGGFANLATLDALERRGRGAVEFIAGRVTRLLRPVAILLVVWFAAGFALERAGLDSRIVRSATKLVCQPLWFVAVYLAVTALAPLMRKLHRRRGVHAATSLFAIAALVDAVRFGAGIEALGYVNLLVVWLFAQQCGFFYGDGSLTRISPRRLATWAAGALTTLAALTTFGPYPHSMVGLPGDKISNMSPPTLCLAVLTVFEIAVAMLLRPVVQRWLQDARRWTVVVAGNGMIMTIFLWHLTAALVTLGMLHLLGAPQPAGATTAWWLTRPIWIALAAAPLAALLAVFSRYERPRPMEYDATTRHAGVLAGIGITLLSIAMFGVACSNVADLLANAKVELAVVTLTPWQLAVAALAGSVLVRRAARPVPTVSAAA